MMGGRYPQSQLLGFTQQPLQPSYALPDPTAVDPLELADEEVQRKPSLIDCLLYCPQCSGSSGRSRARRHGSYASTKNGYDRREERNGHRLSHTSASSAAAAGGAWWCQPDPPIASLLHGPGRSGKTSLLFDWAKSRASEGHRVIYVCNKAKVDSSPLPLPFILDGHEHDMTTTTGGGSGGGGGGGGSDTAVLSRIGMKYVCNREDLLWYLASIHDQPDALLPTALIIDDVDVLIDSSANTLTPSPQKSRGSPSITTNSGGGGGGGGGGDRGGADMTHQTDGGLGALHVLSILQDALAFIGHRKQAIWKESGSGSGKADKGFAEVSTERTFDGVEIEPKVEALMSCSVYEASLMLGFLKRFTRQSFAVRAVDQPGGYDYGREQAFQLSRDASGEGDKCGACDADMPVNDGVISFCHTPTAFVHD